MRFAAVVAMLCAACSGGGPSAVDVDAADGPSGCGDCDAPTLPDAPWPDAPPSSCSTLAYETRPVRSIDLFEDAGRLNAARSFRVAIGYDATPCDRFAMPTWRVVPANGVVRFEANVFAPRGMCPGLPIRRTRVVTLQLPPGDWRLIGVGPAVPPMVAVTIGPPPPEACTGAGGACRKDCDCIGADVCLGGVGLGGPFLQCARPCEADRDCDGGRCNSIEDGLQQTCDASLPECGGPGNGCPDGFTCNGGACAPDFVLSSSSRHECTCDADCIEPLRCIEAAIPGRVARCEIPCPTGGAWCQGPHACGPAAQDVSGLAPSDSVCGWVGE